MGWGGGEAAVGGEHFQNTVQILNNGGLEEAHLHMKKGQFTCGER